MHMHTPDRYVQHPSCKPFQQFLYMTNFLSHRFPPFSIAEWFREQTRDRIVPAFLAAARESDVRGRAIKHCANFICVPPPPPPAHSKQYLRSSPTQRCCPLQDEHLLPAAIEQLSTQLWATIAPVCKAVGSDDAVGRTLSVARAVLFLAAAPEFSKLVSEDYAEALSGFDQLHAWREDEDTAGLEARARGVIATGEDPAPDEDAEDVEELDEVVAVLRKLESFRQMNATLHKLDLFTAVTDTRAFAEIIEQAIERQIADAWEGEFEE